MHGNQVVSERVQGRLERMGVSVQEVASRAGLPLSSVTGLIDGTRDVPRGRSLLKLADVLGTSPPYLVGLGPDDDLPPEYLEEDQGSLGLLAADEDALLRAYRRLDIPSKAALLQVVLKMSPESDASPVNGKPKSGKR